MNSPSGFALECSIQPGAARLGLLYAYPTVEDIRREIHKIFGDDPAAMLLNEVFEGYVFCVWALHHGRATQRVLLSRFLEVSADGLPESDLDQVRRFLADPEGTQNGPEFDVDLEEMEVDIDWAGLAAAFGPLPEPLLAPLDAITVDLSEFPDTWSYLDNETLLHYGLQDLEGGDRHFESAWFSTATADPTEPVSPVAEAIDAGAEWMPYHPPTILTSVDYALGPVWPVQVARHAVWEREGTKPGRWSKRPGYKIAHSPLLPGGEPPEVDRDDGDEADGMFVHIIDSRSQWHHHGDTALWDRIVGLPSVSGDYTGGTDTEFVTIMSSESRDCLLWHGAAGQAWRMRGWGWHPVPGPQPPAGPAAIGEYEDDFYCAASGQLWLLRGDTWTRTGEDDTWRARRLFIPTASPALWSLSQTQLGVWRDGAFRPVADLPEGVSIPFDHHGTTTAWWDDNGTVVIVSPRGTWHLNVTDLVDRAGLADSQS